MNSETIPIANRMPPEAVYVLIVLGATLGVAFLVFLGVLIFRKDEGKRHHHRHHHHHHHRGSYREQIQKTASGIKDLIRHRRHRGRREHRPLNPTLAQTGGLPPIRSPDQPPGTPPPPDAPTP